MEARKIRLLKLYSILFLLMFLLSLPAEALARVGRGMSGGRSFGSRGSRSMTPVQPYTPPSSPGVRPTNPSRPGMSPSGRVDPYSSRSTNSFWSGLGGGFLGGLAGGTLGRWLFGGPSAQGAPENGASRGLDLIDLIILVCVGYLIYWFITKRRRQAASLQGEGYQSSMAETTLQPPHYEDQPPPKEIKWDLQTGLKHIEQSDPLFTEEKFKDRAMDNFFKIQGAWADRDLSTVKHLLTEEMFNLLQGDVEKMRREGTINRLQNVAVREVNLTEAWQESGRDYITVRIYASLLDYTVNDQTGEVVSGSKVEPVKFEEYWTFTRPVGNNPWQLSAINQAE
ncbi:MAG: Tim44 domain-containing protein [Syntrophobacterales bacterium]